MKDNSGDEDDADERRDFGRKSKRSLGSDDETTPAQPTTVCIIQEFWGFFCIVNINEVHLYSLLEDERFSTQRNNEVRTSGNTQEKNTRQRKAYVIEILVINYPPPILMVILLACWRRCKGQIAHGAFRLSSSQQEESQQTKKGKGDEPVQEGGAFSRRKRQGTKKVRVLKKKKKEKRNKLKHSLLFLVE